MKRFILTILLFSFLCMAVTLCEVVTFQEGNENLYPSDVSALEPSDVVNLSDSEEMDKKVLLSPGEEMVARSYILLEDVEFYYDGTEFTITNRRDDEVMFMAEIVGVKKDGSHELIGIPAFYGVDEVQYEKDLAENGWAIQKTTNRVQPGESLNAKMTIVDFGKDYPAWDIDGDGYYDVIFTIHPQRNETTTVVSSDYPESAVYRLAAK